MTADKSLRNSNLPTTAFYSLYWSAIWPSITAGIILTPILVGRESSDVQRNVILSILYFCGAIVLTIVWNRNNKCIINSYQLVFNKGASRFFVAFSSVYPFLHFLPSNIVPSVILVMMLIVVCSILIFNYMHSQGNNIMIKKEDLLEVIFPQLEDKTLRAEGGFYPGVIGLFKEADRGIVIFMDIQCARTLSNIDWINDKLHFEDKAYFKRSDLRPRLVKAASILE